LTPMTRIMARVTFFFGGGASHSPTTIVQIEHIHDILKSAQFPLTLLTTAMQEK